MTLILLFFCESRLLVHNRYDVGKNDSGYRKITIPKESTHNVARNTFLKEVEQTEALKNGSNKNIVRLKSSFGKLMHNFYCKKPEKMYYIK